jgi:hypothetical protein
VLNWCARSKWVCFLLICILLCITRSGSYVLILFSFVTNATHDQTIIPSAFRGHSLLEFDVQKKKLDEEQTPVLSLMLLVWSSPTFILLAATTYDVYRSQLMTCVPNRDGRDWFHGLLALSVSSYCILTAQASLRLIPGMSCVHRIQRKLVVFLLLHIKVNNKYQWLYDPSGN